MNEQIKNKDSINELYSLEKVIDDLLKEETLKEEKPLQDIKQQIKEVLQEDEDENKG